MNTFDIKTCLLIRILKRQNINSSMSRIRTVETSQYKYFYVTIISEQNENTAMLQS